MLVNNIVNFVHNLKEKVDFLYCADTKGFGPKLIQLYN